MFKDDGELFYPAFPGDPEYEGFIGLEYDPDDEDTADLTDETLFPYPAGRGAFVNGGVSCSRNGSYLLSS